MADFSNDITRYIKGEMTPAERHALEKKALSDPFLADALEGAQEVKDTNFLEDVRFLHETIDKKSNEKSSESSLWTWSLRIAAGLLLLLLATYMTWNFIDRDIANPQLSSTDKPEATSPALGSSDSARSKTEKNTLALAEKFDSREKTGSGRTITTEPPAMKKAEPDGNDAKTEDLILEEVTKPTSAAEASSTAGVTSREIPPYPISATEAKNEEEVSGDVAKEEDRSARKSGAKKMVSPSIQQLKNAIRGRVTSAEDGSPLPGVNVVIKGTTTGTITDLSGNYVLENIENASILQYSFIGLQSKEVSVDDKSTLDVALNVDVTQLSEVVVTGYGIGKDSEVAPTVDLAHPTIGNRAYKKYLEESLRYPPKALDTRTEGRVTVEFFVETNGTLTDFIVVKGIGSGCDEELIRLIQEGPAWLPTKKENAPVRDKARVRLKFELPKK